MRPEGTEASLGHDGLDESGVEAPEESATSAPEGTDAAVDEVPAEPDPLAEAERQRDEYLDLAQRTRAEFDNYRKRVAAEADQAATRGRLEVVTGVIETLDNLERVLEAEGLGPEVLTGGGIPEGSPVSLQGVVVAYRELTETLVKAGVERFDPAGEPFDPNLHEAIQAIDAEGVDSGVVVEVLQRGYRAGDQVVRAARVVVSR